MGAKLCKLESPAKEEDQPPAVTLVLPFAGCPGTVGSVPLRDSSPVGHSCFTTLGLVSALPPWAVTPSPYA